MFADIQQFALQAARDACAGKISPAGALAASALLKTLNDNIDAEIAYKGLAIRAKEAGFDLATLVQRPAVLEHQPDHVDSSEARAILGQPIPSRPAKIRKPRIGIVGLLPTQNGVVSEKLAGAVDLEFWNDHQGQGSLEALARGCDAVFLHTRHAGHATDNALKAAGANVVRCTGGVTNILNNIQAYLQKESP